MKYKNQRIAFIGILFLSLSVSTFAGEDAPFVAKHGSLSVKGVSLVDQNDDTLALRGVSFGWHNWWHKYYTKEMVAWLKTDWNATLVRAAIGVEPDSAYLENPQLAMNSLTAVVDAAIENEMYVIIDWHSHAIRLEEAKAFFTEIAGKYKNYPNIIYEIFNEPWGDMPWADVKAYSIELIQTIRAIDPKNVILIGSPHWDQDVDVVADDPITGFDNIMYTLHFYAATHKQNLRDRGDYALSKGLPLFVSECAGMEASGNGPIDTVEWNAWKQWMADRHISWAAWSISSKTETCSMIVADDHPDSSPAPLNNWTENDLKEWGKIIKNELIKNK
jgi:endoglucanase